MSKGIRIGIVIAFVALFAGAVLLKESSRSSTPEDGRAGSAQARQTVAESGLEAVPPGSPNPSAHAPAVPGTPDTALPRLVDLGSHTCIPCKMMAPILAELEREYAGRMIVEFIDVRENRTAASRYSIRVIPTQIFFGPDGKELARHEGFMDEAAILAKWQELGIEL